MSKNKLKVKNGIAQPLGNNYFLMRGPKHEQGGIDIGKNLEVEGGEIVKLNPKSIKVLSNAKIMGDMTPSEYALGGLQNGTFGDRFNKGFKYQEKFKDVNGLNDDGTKAEFGRKKKTIGGEEDNVLYDDKITKLKELRQLYLDSQYNDRMSYYNAYIELAKEIASETLKKYKGTAKDPMRYTNWAKNDEQSKKYLIDSGIRIDRNINNDAKEFLKSYVNSEGFQRIRNNQLNWWKERHPYQKYLYFLKQDKRKINEYVDFINKNADNSTIFTLDGYPRMSFVTNALDKSAFVFKPFREDKENPNYETIMHEFDHIFNRPASYHDTINAEVMQQNKGNKVNGHDELFIEKHSDNLGTKYLLFKEGIYDARGNKDITPEQIQQLREKYPKIRFLQQLNNEDAAFQINNVAQLEKNKDNRDKAFIGIFKKLFNKEDKEDKKDEDEQNNSTLTLEQMRERSKQAFYDSIVNKGFKRIQGNDSPTKEKSEEIEDDIAQRQISMYLTAKNKGHDSEPYYMKYMPEKEIKIDGAGRVSSNMVDSIAVNSVKSVTPFVDALGLFVLESKGGATPNISTEAWAGRFKDENGREPSKEEIHEFENAALNSSFARNHGGIHPQFAINDHEWFKRGWEESPKYKAILSGIESPLQHGLTLYNLGLYNTGDENHTAKVKAAGEKAINSKAIQEWLQTSPYAKDIILKLGGKSQMKQIKRNVPSTGKKIKAALGDIQVLDSITAFGNKRKLPSFDKSAKTLKEYGAIKPREINFNDRTGIINYMVDSLSQDALNANYDEDINVKDVKFDFSNKGIGYETQKIGKSSILNAGDWVNIGANSLGAITNLITGLTSPDIKYARMKDAVPVIAPKINSNVNTIAEENAIDEAYNAEANAINSNTANSQVALNRLRNAGARKASAKVKVRSAAENTRRDLINKGNILAGEYQKYNIGRKEQVDAYNRQAEAAEFNANKDKIGNAISGFVGDIMQGTSTITNAVEQRNADRINTVLSFMGNPNVNVEGFSEGFAKIYEQIYGRQPSKYMLRKFNK